MNRVDIQNIDLNDSFFHFTLKDNLNSIEENGLLSQIGDASELVGDKPRVYLSKGAKGILGIKNSFIYKFKGLRICDIPEGYKKYFSKMNDRYSKVYTEVLEIISHFPEEEYSKIPSEKIKFYEDNKDENYDYKINPEIDLQKQSISVEAEALLVILFRDYFATEKQKEILNNLLKQNQEKSDRAKYEKYNPDNIFKNRKNSSDVQKIVSNKELLPTTIKEENGI